MGSSGIAATLLEGGRTAHATFKVPPDLVHKGSPSCNITKMSSTGQLLKKCDLIIWDECTMSHKHGFEALDCTLQDIRQSEHLFGNVMVMAGDFRQILPVIQQGARADQVTASLKTTNMRARIFGDKGAGQFAVKLLQFGEGGVRTDEGLINTIGPIANIAHNRTELRDKSFLNWLQTTTTSTGYVREPFWLQQMLVFTASMTTFCHSYLGQQRSTSLSTLSQTCQTL